MALFPAANYQNEIVRVVGLNQAMGLPRDFGLTISDHKLIRTYLYHFLEKHYGIFMNTPILHLHHDELPLMHPDNWDQRLKNIFSVNGAINIVTDGDFQPNGRVWNRFGEAEFGPIFPDSHIEFFKTRYYNLQAGTRRRTGYLLEVFTARPKQYVGIVINPEDYALNFRMIKICFPTYEYRYRRLLWCPYAHFLLDFYDRPYPNGPPPTPFSVQQNEE